MAQGADTTGRRIIAIHHNVRQWARPPFLKKHFYLNDRPAFHKNLPPGMHSTGIERVKVDSANEEDGVRKKARQGAGSVLFFAKTKKQTN